LQRVAARRFRPHRLADLGHLRLADVRKRRKPFVLSRPRDGRSSQGIGFGDRRVDGLRRRLGDAESVCNNLTRGRS
jgi:hypothetical protein